LGGLQPWHWIIVIAVFVLLFGAKKLPDAARSLGQSMRIFKSEVKQMKDEDDKTARTAEPSEPLEGKVLGKQNGRADRAEEPVRETPRNL
jgi:sec-independent protein translocase protein TatA